MALESAVYINTLNSSNPLSTDTVSQADDHLRLIKQVLKSTFPNIDGPVTATPAQLNAPVPVGLIAMWSGASVPSGWALCNGANGTPDLRDRFIVGSGSSYVIGNTGGSDSVTLNETQIPSHSHAVNASGTTASGGAHTHSITDPGHSHTITAYSSAANTPQNISESYSYPSYSANYSTAAATTGISVQSAGAHTHTVSVSGTATTTGGGLSHENRPPYYALAFIMKL